MAHPEPGRTHARTHDTLPERALEALRQWARRRVRNELDALPNRAEAVAATRPHREKYLLINHGWHGG